MGRNDFQVFLIRGWLKVRQHDWAYIGTTYNLFKLCKCNIQQDRRNSDAMIDSNVFIVYIIIKFYDL